MATVSLSAFERSYIIRGVQEGIRADGREAKDYRHFDLTTNVIPNTNGSAEIKMERTNIIVGVKAEIGPPNPFEPKRGKIEFAVDCSALASPVFEGKEGGSLGQHLAYRLKEVYYSTGCIDLESLSIVEGQQCWILYVDALVLEWSGGVLDCLSMAIKAALTNTRIPKLTVISGGEGEEMEIEVSDNPYDVTSLDTSNVPIIVTLSLVGRVFIVNASHEEESCAECRLSVAVDQKKRICGVVKEGSGTIPYKQYSDALKLACEVASSVFENVDNCKKLVEDTEPMIH